MAAPTKIVAKTYVLQDPITWGTRLITQLELRKPLAKHLREMDSASGGEVAKLMKIMELISDEPGPVIDELSLGDYKALSEVVLSFLPQPQ